MTHDANKNLRWLYGICIVLTLLITVGLIRELFFPEKLELGNAQLLPSPKSLVSIELKSADGIVNLQQARNAWVMLFMGYTYCPDVCPLELQKLGQMLVKFQEAKGVPPVVAFISVDPERDSAEKTKEYATYFHPAIQGLTGDNLNLRSLANFFGVTYSRSVKIGEKEYLVEAGADMPADSGEHYLVNHSSRIFIINPKGEYIGSFSPPYDTEGLYNDMRALMRQK
jgi:protein SCO1/2